MFRKKLKRSHKKVKGLKTSKINQAKSRFIIKTLAKKTTKVKAFNDLVHLQIYKLLQLTYKLLYITHYLFYK